MDIIEKLERKYSPAPRKEADPEPARVCAEPEPSAAAGSDPEPALSWKDRKSVKNLAALIKNATGFTVYANQNHIGIRFKPGLDLKNQDRFETAVAAWILLCEAEADLRELHDAGRLKI